MFGLDMMIKSLGIDPAQLQKQIAIVVNDVQIARANMEALSVAMKRQNQLLEKIADKLEIEKE